PSLGEKLLIRGCRAFVAMCGRGVIAYSGINMRRHMNEMTGGGSKFLESRSAGEAALRMRRRFDRMNVIMICAEMIRIAFQNRFENCDDFLGSFARASIPQPK